VTPPEFFQTIPCHCLNLRLAENHGLINFVGEAPASAR
jgi:hypothetical protein